jgi:hypothetical protein
MLTFALDERRWLRLFDEADAAELYAVIDANRAHLARWMPWAEGQTPDGTRTSSATACDSSLTTRDSSWR